MSEQLTVLTSGHEVMGSNPSVGGIYLMTVQCFTAQSCFHYYLSIVLMPGEVSVAEWLALPTGSQGPGFESLRRWNSAHVRTAFHGTEHFIITLLLS